MHDSSMPIQDTDLLTVPEVARELGITQGAIRIAIYERRLPSLEKYGRRLVARPDLNHYKQRTQPEGVKRVGRPRKESTSHLCNSSEAVSE
jgi:predicted DNA-binding transcriptional regulator AlpA